MGKSKKRDPIPEHFKSIEEAAEFWDTRDLTETLINVWLSEKLAEVTTSA